jgi:hypothetical protein
MFLLKARMLPFLTTLHTALLLGGSSYFDVLTVTVAAAVDLSKDSKILVHIPFQIHNPHGFDHIKADFGFGSILNGYQSISQYVYYIDQTLCYPVSNHSIGDPDIPEGESWKSPFILLVNGGGLCSHVTKVRNGQMIGTSIHTHISVVSSFSVSVVVSVYLPTYYLPTFI